MPPHVFHAMRASLRPIAKGHFLDEAKLPQSCDGTVMADFHRKIQECINRIRVIGGAIMKAPWDSKGY
jgi:hypothetical protein